MEFTAESLRSRSDAEAWVLQFFLSADFADGRRFFSCDMEGVEEIRFLGENYALEIGERWLMNFGVMNSGFRVLLALAAVLGLGACASGGGEEATTNELKQGRTIDLNSNNVFAWKQEDVERGDGNTITGGKRSSYDQRRESAMGRKNGKSPGYMKRQYHSKAWGGKRDYSKGSYKTESWKGGKRSALAGKSSRESGRAANAAGKNFNTGSYATGRAQEIGRSGIKRNESSYDGRRSGFKPPIYTIDEYRDLTVGQTRSLLGRD